LVIYKWKIHGVGSRRGSKLDEGSQKMTHVGQGGAAIPSIVHYPKGPDLPRVGSQANRRLRRMKKVKGVNTIALRKGGFAFLAAGMKRVRTGTSREIRQFEKCGPHDGRT